jgi:NADPH:quinone reductase-like Zn-dependent oxidoreductase
VVDVRAAPITPLDVLCASGTSYFGVPVVPYIPGVQGAGIVAESDRFAPGTAVWFQTSAGMRAGNGSMAELAVAAEADLLAVPPTVDLSKAAALGLSSVAAWAALTERAHLQEGETVVVLGAGGTVGQVAVQAARLLGAGRVVAATRTPEGRATAEQQGADATVDLSSTHDLDATAQAIRDACLGDADLVIDPVFGLAATAGLRALRHGGRLVHLGAASGPEATFDSATIRSRSLSIIGYTNSSLDSTRTLETLRTVLEHVAAGRLDLAYDQIPLEDVTNGWVAQASGRARRRIVLTTGDDSAE